jgi:hypothetical protein
MLATLIGCGFSDNHETQLAKDESVYQTGNGVKAVKFDDAQFIQLSIWNEGQGAFEKVTNGDYVKLNKDKDNHDIPTIYTLGVTVTPRKVSGGIMDQRVFVSDGGWDYQVEAQYDKDKKLYVCDFKFLPSDYYLTHPVLIQVIYPDGRASKEKYVLHTVADLAAKPGWLVDKGLGLTLSSDLLTKMKPVFSSLLPGMEVQELYPADTTGGDKGILHIDLGSLAFDLILDDTYTPQGGQETRALNIGLEDITGGTPPFDNLLQAIASAFINLFFKNLNLQGIPVMAVGFNLGDLLQGLGGSDDGSEDPLAGLLTGLKIDSMLFLNLKGMPEMTEEKKYAVIGGGLYAVESKYIKKDESGNPLWPTVVVDPYDTQMDLSQLKNDLIPIDLGLALAQYNLNQMLPEIAKGLQLTIPAINKMVPMFTPAKPGEDLDLTLKINPAGIAIDMKEDPENPRPKRIVINDIRLTFVEVGIPQSELSMDLTLNLDVGFPKNPDGTVLPVLTITITPVDELCFIHVMKDNLGMDMFDHSTFVPMIFSGLAGGGGDVKVSISLSDLGILSPPPKEGVKPGQVTFDKNGNCFLGLAVDNLDTSKLPIGGCFIATAGLS